ncbi:hypothetical protein [Enteroscipio rubneri]|nr:hypothetical protein [Enteroscipio rubneri]
MTDKTTFKKTLYLFNQESNRLLQSDWEESPRPFERFLDRMEAEPTIKKYLDDCVANHTPEGFDAAEDVRTVAKEFGATFGSFSTVPEEESAEVYLILKEIVAQNIQGHSHFFYGYAQGNKFADMYKGFLNKVARRLIANIGSYLTMIGIEMGLDGGDSPTANFYGSVQNAQINQPTGSAKVYASQARVMNASDINGLLEAILTAAVAEIDDNETIEDVRDNVEAIRDQVESDKPKRGVLKSALRFLGSINGGTQFTAAVVQIIEFFNESGFQLPFPD